MLVEPFDKLAVLVAGSASVLGNVASWYHSKPDHRYIVMLVVALVLTGLAALAPVRGRMET